MKNLPKTEMPNSHIVIVIIFVLIKMQSFFFFKDWALLEYILKVDIQNNLKTRDPLKKVIKH